MCSECRREIEEERSIGGEEVRSGFGPHEGRKVVGGGPTNPILQRSYGSEQGHVRLKGRGRRAAAAASAVAG